MQPLIDIVCAYLSSSSSGRVKRREYSECIVSEVVEGGNHVN